ncbi:MAG: hypothetical protein IPK81_17885 [Rhodospirillales bacterium]|nr:MAG: hypothetical protein IPK81_17885 [Rhodospirillales bacterium]
MFRFLVPLGLLMAMSPAARAQEQAPGADRYRCERLYALLERYARSGEGQSTVTLDARTALQQCRAGDTARGIPVIEKALRAQGFKP